MVGNERKERLFYGQKHVFPFNSNIDIFKLPIVRILLLQIVTFEGNYIEFFIASDFLACFVHHSCA